MSSQPVERRRIPYPYRAMLAVCSDLDETPDRRAYWEIMRFLNTAETTSMGPGVALEVGNSIYFDMPPGQFAYWSTDDAGREMVRRLIRSGHVDCLHSYGDLATTRAHAGRALDELARHGCRLEVWVDHAVAATNFGADIMRGHGDEPGHEAYHADLTTGHGVAFVWRGRVTSVVGQDVRPRLGGIFTARHPARSAATVAKEAAKRILARCGSRKYAMHGPNRLLRRSRLRDGRGIFEFLRSNPHWAGVAEGATAQGLGRTLSDAALGRLVRREGVCVLYTHLGKCRDGGPPFDDATVAAFRRLAEGHRDGKILVTTTRRLLGYCRAAEEVSFSVSRDSGGLRLDLSTRRRGAGNGELPASDLSGLTFHVPDPDRTRLTLNGRDLPGIVRNPPDHTHRPSVSLPWPALELPKP